MAMKVLDLVPDCYSWEHGNTVGEAIRTALDGGQKVVVSFAGVDDIPSTFVNGAFVPLLKLYSLDYVRQHLAVVNSTRQINDIIRRRLEFESRRLHPVAA